MFRLAAVAAFLLGSTLAVGCGDAPSSTVEPPTSTIEPLADGTHGCETCVLPGKPKSVVNENAAPGTLEVGGGTTAGCDTCALGSRRVQLGGGQSCDTCTVGVVH